MMTFLVIDLFFSVFCLSLLSEIRYNYNIYDHLLDEKPKKAEKMSFVTPF